jgi:SNF2 family DNA or RNA helicase
VHFPYDPTLLEGVRTVPGAEFDRRSKLWRIPMDEYALSALMEVFPTADIEQDVKDWAKERLQRRQQLLDAKTAADADLFYERAADLRPYQRTAVRFLALAEGGLLADEMGLGKTVEMLAALREMEIMDGDGTKELSTYLIVCPNSMRSVWEKEIKEWWPYDYPIYHVEGEVKGKPPYGFWICNWERTHRRAWLADHLWSAIVCDESHRMKGRDTKQSKAVRSFEGRRRFLLTGTPIKNEVTDLWPQLQFLEPDRWTSYWKFFDRYVAWKEGFFGKEITGARNEEELRGRIATTVIGRTIDDVDLQLPDLVKRRITVDLGKQQRRAYDQMRDEFIAEMTGNDDDVIAANWLTQVLRLKQIAGSLGIFSSVDKDSAKIDALMELIGDAPDTEKWVVMSQFRTMTEEVRRRFESDGIAYCILTGQEAGAWMPGPGGWFPSKDRAQLIDWFQRSDKPRVFLATIQTGGEGITLTAARRMVFLDLMWTPADNLQAMKRIHRFGQNRTSFVYEILARGTIDFSAILPTLKRKQDIIDAIMDPPDEEDDDAVQGP